MRTLVAGGSVALAGILLAWAQIAEAQQNAAPGASSAAPLGSAAVAAPPALASAPPAADPGAEQAPKELLEVHPGGLTAEQVGARAAATSWSAKADEETLRGAAARVDEAWAAFLPRLSGIAKYTRLSPLTPPNLGTLPAATTPQFGANGQPVLITTANLNAEGLLPVNLEFPVLVDNYLLQATITVPISDYFARIDQNYTAATRSQDAARWDVIAARAVAGSNGKVAYYTWLRARGAVVVAVLALEDQRTHYRDAQNQFAVGNASKADVLRAETSVASAELALDRAKNLADLSEKQVRVAIHAGDDDAILPGEDLEGPLSPVPGSVKEWTAEALRNRPEIRSANANAEAAREQATVTKSGRYPSLSAFADGIYANPNQRIFPQTNTWFGSWDLGAQLTWSPNDVITTNGAVGDAESRVAAIEANRNNVRDSIDIEVTQSWQAVQEADFSMGTSARELASAEEAYRVARELFNNGRGTSTTLTDAETDLTRARLDLLNAKADARIGRIRLDHAIGRDAGPR